MTAREEVSLPEGSERAVKLRPFPRLLSVEEKAALLKEAEVLWDELQQNDLGGFSGINRPFFILSVFRQVIERFGGRDTGYTWSQDELAAHPRDDNADRRARFEAAMKAGIEVMRKGIKHRLAEDVIDFAFAAWTAAEAQRPSVAGADGWQLVPKEPDLFMCEAGRARCRVEYTLPEDIYRAMLDAAPRPATDATTFACQGEGDGCEGADCELCGGTGSRRISEMSDQFVAGFHARVAAAPHPPAAADEREAKDAEAIGAMRLSFSELIDTLVGRAGQLGANGGDDDAEECCRIRCELVRLYECALENEHAARTALASHPVAPAAWKRAHSDIVSLVQKGYTSDELIARITHVMRPVAPAAQERCDTTRVERFVNPACVCKTYDGNLGPCGAHEVGGNGRCVWCDHEMTCVAPAATQDDLTAAQKKRCVEIWASAESTPEAIERAMREGIAASSQLPAGQAVGEIIGGRIVWNDLCPPSGTKLGVIATPAVEPWVDPDTGEQRVAPRPAAHKQPPRAAAPSQPIAPLKRALHRAIKQLIANSVHMHGEKDRKWMIDACIDQAFTAAPSMAAKEGIREWLRHNLTFYDTEGRTEGPVLASVSKRIWYHATDDQTSYPFDEVIARALDTKQGGATNG